MTTNLAEILVPIDLSAIADRALPIARTLAAGLGLPLDVVTVASPFGDDVADRRLLRGRLEGMSGVPSSCTVLHGEVVHAIVQRASEQQALLCMSTHGRGALTRTVFGSVAGEVLACSAGPVVLVGPQVDVSRFGPVRSLVLATDGGLQLLPEGPVAWLARRLAVPVHVVGVHEIGGVIAPGAPLSEATLLDHVEQLCASLAAIGVAARPTVVRDEHAGTAIASVADTLASPLVVLTRRLSSRAGRADHSHVVSAAVRDAKAPVVVVPRIAIDVS